MKKVNRKRMNDEAGFNIWRSYSDMMSGLLLLFVLIMAVCLMQAQKNYNDKLAEQASRAQTQTELTKAQDALSQRETELQEAQSQLNARESELEEKTTSLTDLETALESQAEELKKSQDQVAQQESELSQKESELASRDQALAQSQQELDNANALMKSQQEKIDQIVGVKADLISALNAEFRKQQIDVDIDGQTGAIVLNSNVLFDFGESELTEQGQAVLAQVLPTYCSVLLSDQYKDYVAEVIIDGYTDSSGTYLDNLTLSQNRAYAVAAYLLDSSSSFLTDAQNKELAGKLTANGRSKSNLVLDENGQEDAEASRRVEIKFRLKDEEMIQELSQIIADSRNQQG